MGGRPEILFPLFADMETLSGVGPRTAQALARIGLRRPRDLLFHLPQSVLRRHHVQSVQEMLRKAGRNMDRMAAAAASRGPGHVTLEATVIGHMPPRQRSRPWRVEMRDGEGVFQLVFFHPRADYLKRILPEGARRVVSGKLELFDGIPQIVHPDYILPPAAAGEVPDFEPHYPLTEGVSRKQMAKAVQGALTRAPELPEWIDPALLTREGWPAWRAALTAVHAPESDADLSPMAPARARLAYDEFLAHQLALALARRTNRRGKGQRSCGSGVLRARVLSAFPHEPTGAQRRVIGEIEADMANERRMMRLLQGDVGAGKTLVALMALLIAVEAGGQGVLMAPTELLARQHLQAMQPLAGAAGVQIEILTGRDKGSERRRKLAALAGGETDILVGTHAVFQPDVVYRDLRLAVIDEQHRFGVRQRLELGEKGDAADILVMTATPIPRSLALTQYGDMDISVLDEKPPGRQPVKTAVVSMQRIDEVVAHMRDAIGRGEQAYWVCPLVEESEQSDLTAAEERFAALRARLGEGVVGLVHGRMPPEEKDAAMARFVAGETRVLVATTVIEVGVDVPAATIMVVERAERFGLAQLHQLRGRVGRGGKPATCLLLYKAPISGSGRRRLEILRQTEDGFRIAEEDLAMRGAGDLIGHAQSGLPRFQVADPVSQTRLMTMARMDARKLLHGDETLCSSRGEAARLLLWLMERDKYISLISVG